MKAEKKVGTGLRLFNVVRLLGQNTIHMTGKLKKMEIVKTIVTCIHLTYHHIMIYLAFIIYFIVSKYL